MIEPLLRKKHRKRRRNMVHISLSIMYSNLLLHKKEIKMGRIKMMMILIETRLQVRLTLLISPYQILFVLHRSLFLRPVRAAKTKL